jgi:hypothetical protein
VALFYLQAKASTTLGKGSTAANELKLNENNAHAKVVQRQQQCFQAQV